MKSGNLVLGDLDWQRTGTHGHCWIPCEGLLHFGVHLGRNVFGEYVFTSGIAMLEICGVWPVERSPIGLERAIGKLPERMGHVVSKMVQESHFGRPTMTQVRKSMEESNIF